MLNLALLRYNHLGALDIPIVCAAPAYQGLDLNESLLIRFFGLELFAGRTTELFLIAFSDMVPPNITSADIHLTPTALHLTQSSIQRHSGSPVEIKFFLRSICCSDPGRLAVLSRRRHSSLHAIQSRSGSNGGLVPDGTAGTYAP